MNFDSLLVSRRLPFGPVRRVDEWQGSAIITAGPDIPHGRDERVTDVWLATMGGLDGNQLSAELDDVPRLVGATWRPSRTRRSLQRIARSST